ncbi:mechanosensitive ion channel domain-containing protein [Rhodohalobacter sp. 8-1]|uniref:mechanosensitive ion channel domain-containing protein n=1 Tax=Rhodohalobacter sp. 8-1 TaxID=3131972 RepID=UPI0030ED2BEE
MLQTLQSLIENAQMSYSEFRLIINTILLLLFVFILRVLSRRYILNSVTSQELRRKWIVQSRNGLILLFFLGILLIWGEELRTLALSVVAIAVALVIATKELILCVTGSILKSGASSFDIGDRIQVKEFRGDVIDQNLLATTILEVGPGKMTQQRTGRMTVIPNALFLSDPVINESFTHEYVLHVFTVPFKREENWKAAQEAIQKSADKYCAPYLEDARSIMEKLSDRRGLDVPSVDPRVRISVPAAGEVHLIVRVPAKTTERSFIEQAILSDVFENHDFTGNP